MHMLPHLLLLDKNVSTPKVIEKPAPQASANYLPADKNPDIPLQSMTKKNPAYTYKSKAILPKALSSIKKKILESLVSGISISPKLHRETMDYCKTQRVLVTASPELSPSALILALMRPFQVEYAEPLRELRVVVNGKKEEPRLLDGGSEIVLIREDLWKEVGASANVKKRMMMEAENGSTSELPRCVEMLEIDVEGLKTWAHAFIVPSTPYWLLLGRPWQQLVRLEQEETEDSVLVTIHHPYNSSNLCTCDTMARSPFPHSASLTAMVMLTPESFRPRSQLSVVDGLTAEKVLSEHYELDPVR